MDWLCRSQVPTYLGIFVFCISVPALVESSANFPFPFRLKYPGFFFAKGCYWEQSG